MIPLALLFNRYTAGAALAVALAAGGYAYRAHLIGIGYSRAQTELQAQQSERLREQLKETSRLVGIVKEAQDAYTEQMASVEGFRDRARAAERRLREQAADLDRRIATASAASLRGYAQASERNLDGLRADVERFGLEAASCSATAYALKAAQAPPAAP